MDAAPATATSTSSGGSGGFGHFESALSQIGSARDKGAGEIRVVRQRRLSDVEIEALSESHLGGRIVEDVPRETVRGGFGVPCGGDQELSRYVESRLAELGAEARLLEADIAGEKWGGGVIAMGIADGVTVDKPVDVANIAGENGKVLLWLRSAKGPDAVPQLYSADPSSRHYSKPASYSITPPAGVPSDGGDTYHADRVIRVNAGLPCDERERHEQLSWGRRRLDRVVAALWRHGIVSGSSATLIQELNLFTYAMDLRPILTASDGDSKLIRRLSQVALGKSIVGGILHDKEESAGNLTRSLAGVADLWDRAAVDVAAAAEQPYTRLWGVSPGGLSTDDASGSRNWHARINEHRRVVASPTISEIVLYILLERMSYEQAMKIDRTPVFAPLDEPGYSEEAELLERLSRATALLVQWRVMSQAEARSLVGAFRSSVPSLRAVDLSKAYTPRPEPEVTQ